MVMRAWWIAVCVPGIRPCAIPGQQFSQAFLYEEKKIIIA